MAKARQDKLALVGIRLQSRLGVTADERRVPQTCVTDITVWGDFEAAAATDDIQDALDYTRILGKAIDVAQQREYNLLETLAYRLARMLLEAFPVERVHVKVRKQPAALMGHLDHIEVEIEQS